MKTKLRLILALWGLLFLSLTGTSLMAQVSEGGVPPSFAFSNLTQQTKAPVVVPLSVDINQLKAEDAQRDAAGLPPRAVWVNPVQLTPENSGEWTTLPDGRSMWRLAIQSPGAIATMLTYDAFVIPKGGKLFIYNPTRSQVLGAYTSRTNAKRAEFATELVGGSQLILEYVSPMPMTGKSRPAVTEGDLITNATELQREEQLQLIISGVGYGYNHLKTTGGGDQLQIVWPSLPCQVNVNCPEGADWQHQKRGVARILTYSGGSYGLCSGTVINNTSGDLDPLFLSAHHCYQDMTPSLMNQSVYYFNYEAPGCSSASGYDPDPSGTQTVVGATLLVDVPLNAGSDGALLRLNELIPESYNVFYNGWDRRSTAPTSGVGISHPQGDIKKIATYTATATSTTANMNSGEVGAASAHWQVYFVATPSGFALTQGGSSGSPLFNQDKRVVGTLTGGPTETCTNPTGRSIYGKLWYHWDQGAQKMKNFLDPTNTGVDFIDGMYASGNILANFSASRTTIYASESITFTDMSYGATTWAWTFSGGLPASHTGQTPPTVLYNTPGSYNAKLVVNAGTADEKEKTITITVKQKEASCPNVQEVGTTGTAKAQFPLGIATRQTFSSSIYTAAELGNAAGTISEVAWNASQPTALTRTLYVYLKEVDDATITADTWANEIAGATLVYQSTAYWMNDAGWTSVKLTTPFVYSGTKNLKVIVRTSAAAAGTTSSDCYYTASTNTHMEWTSISATVPTAAGTVNDNRPNIKITINQDCGAIAPVANFTAAKDVYALNEGFDGTLFPPLGWTIEKPGASASAWVRSGVTNYLFSTIDPSSISSALVVNETGANSIDTWLKSPAVSVADVSTQLEFYTLYQGTTLANVTISCYVSTDGGTTWGTPVWTAGNTNTNMGLMWRKQTLSLAAYNGQTIQLAWRVVGRAGNHIGLDGVKVFTPNTTGKVTIFEGQTVSFTDLSSGPPVSWNWTLPSGKPASSTLQNPTATYMNQGVYDATLAVTNNLGSDTKIITGAVTVQARVPLPAMASASNGLIQQANRGQFLPLTGGEVELTDTSAYYPTSRTWTMTGATPAASTNKQPLVVYPAGENNYAVTLNATNVAGTASLTIPDYVKVGGMAEVWNVQYGESPTTRYTASNLSITGADAYPQTAERFDAPASGEVSKVRIFTQNVMRGTGQMIVAIYSDNGGLPGVALSPVMVIPAASIAASGYNTITFPTPVPVSGTFHVVVGSTNYNTTYFAVPSVPTRTSNGTASALRLGVWTKLESIYTGLYISMNIVPEFKYTDITISGTTSFVKKNIDPSTSTINITANTAWTVTANPWITLSSTSGTGNGSFSFGVLNNNEANPRNGLITIKGGGITKYVVVQQIGTNPTKLAATFMDDSEDPVHLVWQAPVTTAAYVPGQDLFDDAESHTDFTVNSGGNYGWTYIDGDARTTYPIVGVSFPASGLPMAFVVFNPSQTTPASTAANTQPHSGNKYFACFNATTPSNNDWMISPRLGFTSSFKFSFWAKSATDQYSGGERMRVAYSTGGNTQADFTNVLTTEPYVTVPMAAWTRYEFTVPASAKYVAINCVSDDEFILMVDDIFIGTGVAPASTVTTAPAQRVGEQPQWTQAHKQLSVEPNSIPNGKKQLSIFEAAPITSSLIETEDASLMAAAPYVKLRWDNGANSTAIGTNGGGLVEVAARFETPEQLSYHGLKLLAVDIFPKAPGSSMTLNIRQDGVIVHTQPVTGLVAGQFNRITLTTPVTIDASKELTVGYSYVQTPGNGNFVAGCDAGPAVKGKGDLIALNGGPLEPLSSISSLNYNWNIAVLVENKLGENVKLQYNVYRNNTKIATVSPTSYDDMANLQYNSCYKITALYNDVLESTPSNDNCISAKHLITVGVTDVTRTVGQANPTFVLSYSGFIDGDTEAVLNAKPTATCTATAASPAGTYAITVSGGTDDKYCFEYVPGTLTVEKKALTVTVANASRYVGQANPVFVLGYTGFIGSDTEAVLDTKPAATCVADHTSPAGTYPINISGGLDDMYSFTYVPATLTVANQVELVVGVTSVSRMVGDANPTFVLQYSGFTNGDTPASLTQQPVTTCFATTTSPVGTYPIIVSGGVDSKYKFTYVQGTLTVTPKPQVELVVSVNSVSRFVGDANPAFQLQYSGFTNGDTPAGLTQQPTATCFANTASSAGTYPISVSGGVDSKYKFTYVQGTLTVSKRTLTVRIQDATRMVGDPDPVFQVTYSGFVNGDGTATLNQVPTAITATGASSTAGTYPITLSGGLSDKYDLVLVPGTLTIKKYPLTVGVKNVTRKIGQANPEFELVYTGFVAGDTPSMISTKPTITCSANTQSPVGTYAVNLNGGSSNKYELNFVSGTLTVAGTPVNRETNAFTPYDLDGYNDVFMTGAKISVVNRYGQVIFEGNNGWDGKKKNSTELVPPGVYYYQATFSDGTTQRGSVNVVKK